MKWILISLLFLLCVFVGYMFSKKYKRRASFFKGLVMLAQKLDVGINFSRERLTSMFNGLDDKLKKDLQNIQDNFIAYLSGKGELTTENLFKNIQYIKDNEKDVVLMFFKMLGRSDVDSQCKEIQNFEARFQDFASAALAESKKYSGLSLKMGLIIGLLCVIVLW